MYATALFICITTVSLVTIPILGQSQANAASSSVGGSASSPSQETEKQAIPRKANPNVTPGGTPSTGTLKQAPAQDRSQVVEERLRSGQMEKPIAQGEVSDRLNQLYSGSNSPVH